MNAKTMTKEEFISLFNPCEGGIYLINKSSSLEEAWDKCEDIPMLIWCLEKLSIYDKKKLSVFCYRLITENKVNGKSAFDYLKDPRSIKAIEALKEFIDRDIAISSAVRRDATAAVAAAYAATANAAGYYAAEAVAAAANAVYYAAGYNAAEAAANAAYYAAYYAAAAREEFHKKSAVLFKEIFENPFK